MLCAYWRSSLENADTQDKAAPGKKRSPLRATFASFRHRNYRLFFFGQMISLPGTHMQWAAQAWLVYKITESKFDLGFIRMVSTLPMAILPILAGVLADRVRRKNILLVTQSIAILPPVILSVLVLAGIAEVWHIAVLACATGVIVSFDIPARQAFVVEIVGKKDLSNAIGLNSGIFNSARIIGPWMAGHIMALVGIAFCFMINGLSYIAVVVALLLISVPRTPPDPQREPVRRRVAAGLKHVRSDSQIMGLLGLLALIVTFGFSYMALLPAFARDVFGLEEAGYGNLLAFNGIGAVVGSLIVASTASRGGRRKLIFAGVLIFSLAITAFSFAGSFWPGAIALLFVGVGMIMFFSTANTLVQSVVSDEYRGRVMGIWTFVFGGSLPVGSILAGTAAEYLGIAITVKIGALVCAVAALAASIVGKRVKARAARLEPPEVPEIQIPY